MGAQTAFGTDNDFGKVHKEEADRRFVDCIFSECPSAPEGGGAYSFKFRDLATLS